MPSRQQSRDFLTRLHSDPAFRAQVESDPVGTMAQYGFQIRPEDVPPEGIKLPSNDAIKSNIDSLSERLESTAGEVFFKI